MATTTTTNLGMTLAVPGSNEPFDTAVVNANFEAIDTEVGAQRSEASSTDTRLDTIEKFTNPTVTTPTMGVIPSGTAAQRDGLYGIPATAADRVALAAKAPRWFNTEKGYEQQYFAQYDDAGAGIFAKDVHGWGLAAHLKETPLANFTVTGTVGTFSKRGAVAVCAGGTSLQIDGLFNADFTDYRLLIETTAGGVIDIYSRLCAAGAADSSAGYSVNGLIVNNAGTVSSPVSGATDRWTFGSNTTQGATYEVFLRSPFPNTYTTHMTRVYSQSNQQELRGGTYAASKVFDGILLAVASGNWTGRVRAFGINDY